jgi:quercetin dioxygenase-like cupin family protein
MTSAASLQSSLTGETAVAGISIVRKFEGEQLKAMGVGVRFVCRGEQTRSAWSLMECVIPRDHGPPPHEHPWDEAYYVIEGAARFMVAGKELLARAGDFIYAPAGTVHAFQGAGEQPARVLIFDAPAAAEGFFRDAAAEVREMPQDLRKVPAIGQRHRIRFLVP